MSVPGRFWNFVRGLFWQGQRTLEQANPEAVYEMAIHKMKSQYQSMHTAVGRLAAERNRLRSLLEGKTAKLATVERDLEAALREAEAGNAAGQELGEELVNEKEAMEGEISSLRQELARSEQLVGDYLGKLRELEGRTRQMESKKDAMIAKLQSAHARKAFNDMMSGMSTNAEESAVSDIDKYIEGVAAQADITDEMSGATREEKLRKLREQSKTRESKTKFQAMLEARQSAQGAPSPLTAGSVQATKGTARAADGKAGLG